MIFEKTTLQISDLLDFIELKICAFRYFKFAVKNFINFLIHLIMKLLQTKLFNVIFLTNKKTNAANTRS